MRILFSGVLAIALFIACKPSAPGDQPGSTTTTPKQMEDALMAIHDTAMVKLNEINRLSSDLRNIRAEVNVTDQGSDAYPTGLDNVLEDLKMADQAMWDWMKSYSDNRATQTEEQLMAFYEREMEKIKTVNAAIDNSIANAKNWLAAHGTAPK